MTPERVEFLENEWVKYFIENAEYKPLTKLFNDFANIYSATYDEYNDIWNIITEAQEEVVQKQLNDLALTTAAVYNKKWKEHCADPENFLLEVEIEMLVKVVYELEHLNPHPYNFKYNTRYQNQNGYGNLQEKRF